MREFIVGCYNLLLELNVWVATIAGFVVGGFIGGLGSGLFGGSSFNMTTAIVGAVIAFCNATLISGAGLVLNQVAELLEEQNSILRRQAERPQPTPSNFTIPQSIPPSTDTRDLVICQKCGTKQVADRELCWRCGAELAKTI